MNLEQAAAEYAQTHDPRLREQVVIGHQALVRHCVRRTGRPWEEYDELTQVCNVGLLEALGRFDPERGVRFSTYAEHTLNGVLRHHFRAGWAVHVPRPLQEARTGMRRAENDVTEELQRTPTLEEIANRAGLPVDVAREAQYAAQNFTPLELQWDAEVPADTDADVEALAVRVLLRRLNQRQRSVVYLRFYEGLPQAEIGERLGLSQPRVGVILRDALERLAVLAA